MVVLDHNENITFANEAMLKYIGMTKTEKQQTRMYTPYWICLFPNEGNLGSMARGCKKE